MEYNAYYHEKAHDGILKYIKNSSSDGIIREFA